MSFTDQQVRQLRAPLRRQHVKEREIDGKLLHYLEGWQLIAEANRIFGFDGWDRETVSSQCVWQRQVERGFAAAYLTRVKVCVRAGDRLVVREGLGSGEATASTPGQAHERASKGAETDATKRALSTFGNPFGLSLYGGEKAPRARKAAMTDQGARRNAATLRAPAALPLVAEPAVRASRTHPLQNNTGLRIEKSELALGEPRRLRDRDHLRFVASQPCLVCGRTPSQAHHLRFAQPRAMARKVSDEFTVPLCALHHHELHQRGDERGWWAGHNIEPLAAAGDLWASSRGSPPPGKDAAAAGFDPTL